MGDETGHHKAVRTTVVGSKREKLKSRTAEEQRRRAVELLLPSYPDLLRFLRLQRFSASAYRFTSFLYELSVGYNSS
jgi:hypothetical protein